MTSFINMCQRAKNNFISLSMPLSKLPFKIKQTKQNIDKNKFRSDIQISNQSSQGVSALVLMDEQHTADYMTAKWLMIMIMIETECRTKSQHKVR
jgi:hypothetical protein